MNKSNRTVTIERVLNIPLEQVWEAWTQPEHIVKWWGPQGMETKIIHHNCSLGGEWMYTMTMSNGQEFIAQGKYTEIIEFKNITSKASFKPMTNEVEIQSLFEKIENKTQFTFNIINPTEEIKIQQENMGILKGWNSTFDRLNTFLLGLKS